jgi:membrane protein
MRFVSLKKFIGLLTQAFREFREKDPLSLAGATAFFTSFALPPIVIILIQVFGWVLNKKTISDQLFEHLAIVLGRDSMIVIRRTSKGFERLAHNWYIIAGGFIFMIFIATTLFIQLSKSLNQLWNIKVENHRGFAGFLKPRLKSLVVIIVTGVLFVAHLKVEILQVMMLDNIHVHSGLKGFLSSALSVALSGIIMSTWFTLLFKYLASAHPQWRIAIAGGIFTGLLYGIGKLLLGRFLTTNNISPVFGFSGSFVQVLLFVFYISFILYYGWMFTKIWSKYRGQPILLDRDAYEFIPVVPKAGQKIVRDKKVK